MINLFLFVAILYLICFIGYLIYAAIKKKKFKLKDSYIYIIFFCLSIAIISIFIKPGESFDLTVYYKIVNRYRITGNIGNEFGSNTIIFKAFLMGMALLKNNFWIQFYMVLIVYMLIMLCFIKQLQEFKNDWSILLFSLIFQETLMSFVYIYSGGRNQWAFGLIAVLIIIYFFNPDFIKNKIGLSVTIGLLIASFSLHDSIFIIVLLFCLYILIKDKKYSFLIMFWGLSIPLFQLLNSFSIPIIAPLISKLSLYLSGTYQLDLRIVIINYCILFYLLVLLHMKTNFGDKYKQIDKFLSIIIFFALGSFLIPEIQRRLLYFISFFSVYIIYKLQSLIKYKKMMIVIMVIFVAALGAYHLINLISNGATMILY